MKKYLIHMLLILCLLFPGGKHRIFAQVSASVSLSRSNVYVQEPFRVTITVYTSTWFTAPVEFGNLQIPNAFIVPFDETQPGMFTFGGKQYPGIQFYYIVFPYKAGTFTVPAFEVTAQSPPEGSSTSRKVVIHTVPHTFVVKDVPEKLKNMENWFVAKGVTIQESWSQNLQTLKVGDVLKRTITIDAKGTLPQFIPALTNQVQVKWGSTYPQDPILQDTRGGGDANGRSTQTITYLLEKAGDFTIPEINLPFWNPYSNQISAQSIPEEKIHIADNPNLGILTSLKDSLNATAKTTVGNPTEKGPLRILGIIWYYFLGMVVAALFLLYIIIRLLIRTCRKLSARRRNYLESEEYKFKQLMRTNKNSVTFLNALYTWWDSLKYRPSASVTASLIETQEEKDADIIRTFMEDTVSQKPVSNGEDVKQVIKKYREKQGDKNLRKDKGVNDEQKNWEL